MDPIQVEMAPLFKQARAEGKWFFTHYQGIWFSPDELERQQANGKFRWGAINWKLRDPRGMIEEAQRNVDNALAELGRVKARVAGGA